MKSAKRILLSLVMVVAVASVATYATRAYFSDTETSEGNTLTAGEIDLRVSAHLQSPTDQEVNLDAYNLDGSPLFTFIDLKPGDMGGGYFDLIVTSNQAYACVNAEVTDMPENGIVDPEEEFGDLTEDEGELQNYLKVWFWNDENGNGELDPAEESSVVGPVDLSTTNGTEGWETLTDPTGGVFGTAGMTPETEYNLGMKYCMGDLNTETGECSGEGNQNDAQTDGVVANLAFYAVQTRNNPEFSCESMNGPEVNEGELDLDADGGVRFRSFGNTGGNEMYLGVSDLGDGGNRVEQGYTWVKPGSYPIELSFDKSTETLSAQLDGGSVESYAVPAGSTTCWDGMQITIANRDTDTTVNLNEVDLNGYSLGDFDSGLGNSGWHFWNVTGFDFSEDFTFTGEVEVDGPFGGSQELSKIEVLVGCN